MQRAASTKIWERSEEFVREIGTLLVALAPLDAVVDDVRVRWRWLLFFLVLGIFLFGTALFTELWRQNDA